MKCTVYFYKFYSQLEVGQHRQSKNKTICSWSVYIQYILFCKRGKPFILIVYV